MADSKRAGTNAKTTPARAATSSPAVKDTMESLSKAIGSRVKITTVGLASQTLEGQVFTADPILNIVAINTKVSNSATANGAASTCDYHLLPTSNISSFQILSQAPSDSAPAPLGPANLKKAKERVEARVQALKEQDASRGKGVTKEAQAIFDALKRVNIPIRWHDKQMIAHEAVIIAPPYRPEDCKGSKDKQQVLNQVKKVLEGERKKLKEREDRELSQRKGG